MSVKEEEDQKAKERASAYHLMMNMWAFKDFLELISSVKGDAIKSLYQMPNEQATEAKFGEIRGILKAIDKIERELDYILSYKEGI